ncbi:MAG: general secretion pathway protein GspK [Verrucomicrobia bacterium]|nr:general secretion pathway protein GspK [Verrucomicrobiota bacterium]HRY58532.1 general secretion pathway protein GspK [Candidatus Paceibacterota bacterium]HOW80556.1 general secretion pathway protein GspK [Verrucomicrobiota bacterium]HQE90952.1 general secretion pathway protein GspK [Verrucomicrobiota bacterium]HQH02737.1 general secretion pathway protein GspK [Verrucomicrobiota bacterium]
MRTALPASRPRARAAPRPAPPGIAMVIVMISIMVLSVLAAGFAFSMKVETKLARNANSEADLEWLGRSGVEYARWVLGNSLLNPQQPYDSLDQPWATGYGILGPTNNPIGEVQKTIELGRGSFTWTITDLERKFNINSPEPVLQQILPQALNLMGVSPGESTALINSILDWTDRDDQTHVEGAESRYYESSDPPYFAKNGPIDDMAELLFVKGMTPEIYYGLSSTNYQPSYYSQQRNRFVRGRSPMPTVAVGLTDLFTPISTGRVNVNTAPVEVLMVLPGVNEIIANAIHSRAMEPSDISGLTGPFRTVDQLRSLPDVPLELVRLIQPFCDVRSKTFQVQIDADVGGYKRTFFAILGRNNQRDVQILSFYWQ